MFSKFLLQKLLQSERVEGDATKACLTKDLILHLKVELTQLCDALLCCSIIILYTGTKRWSKQDEHFGFVQLKARNGIPYSYQENKQLRGIF